MFLRVEKGSAVPISRQIADQIRALCLAGTLRPREKLPSVRQTARDLAVNQNTVLRVYERLTAEGLLEMRHGEGTFVTSRPPTWRLSGQRRQFTEELAQLVRRGVMLGIGTRELEELVRQAVTIAGQELAQEQTRAQAISQREKAS